MTLSQELKTQLANLSSFSTGEQVLEITHGTQRLSCRLVALDSLACAFTRLALQTESLSTRTSGELRQLAESLSARLNYLLEPISPIELDAQGCVAQLRSNPPQKEEDRTSYYELLVSRSGALSLTRYSRSTGQERQVIAAHVTREVLARLVADFAAVAP
jgi:hypothetical protein